MDFVLQPWQLYFVILVGWVQRQQQEVIHYLIAENRVLKERIGKKRILLNDDQRRRLAVKGKLLGRKRLQEIGTLFTPDTILRWHRTLVARRWDYSNRRKNQVGRPRVRQVIVELILRFAKDNPTWGYDRIQGALANVGEDVTGTLRCRSGDTKAQRSCRSRAFGTPRWYRGPDSRLRTGTRPSLRRRALPDDRTLPANRQRGQGNRH